MWDKTNYETYHKTMNFVSCNDLMDSTVINRCVVCEEDCPEALPCGHFTCDRCLENYIDTVELSHSHQRLTFNHLFCPQRCGCYIGDHYARKQPNDIKEKISRSHAKMLSVRKMALDKLLEDNGSSSEHLAVTEDESVLSAFYEEALRTHSFYECTECFTIVYGGLVRC